MGSHLSALDILELTGGEASRLAEHAGARRRGASVNLDNAVNLGLGIIVIVVFIVGGSVTSPTETADVISPS
jgi:hypothetical protein